MKTGQVEKTRYQVFTLNDKIRSNKEVSNIAESIQVKSALRAGKCDWSKCLCGARFKIEQQSKACNRKK